jgi:four helix bundle protein
MSSAGIGMKYSAGRGENPVLEKSYNFAIEVIELYKNMTAQKEFVLSKQLLRSGTSIGANVEEAQAGQSRSDFLHKMSMACKEARETRYWLRLLDKSQLCKVDCAALLEGAEELLRLLNSIIKTTRGEQKRTHS